MKEHLVYVTTEVKIRCADDSIEKHLESWRGNYGEDFDMEDMIGYIAENGILTGNSSTQYIDGLADINADIWITGTETDSVYEV